jgi:hypothetical protein
MRKGSACTRFSIMRFCEVTCSTITIWAEILLSTLTRINRMGVGESRGWHYPGAGSPVSYSRKGRVLVCKLTNALVAEKRDARVDWKDIPLVTVGK